MSLDAGGVCQGCDVPRLDSLRAEPRAVTVVTVAPVTAVTHNRGTPTHFPSLEMKLPTVPSVRGENVFDTPILGPLYSRFTLVHFQAWKVDGAPRL